MQGSIPAIENQIRIKMILKIHVPGSNDEEITFHLPKISDNDKQKLEDFHEYLREIKVLYCKYVNLMLNLEDFIIKMDEVMAKLDI